MANDTLFISMAEGRRLVDKLERELSECRKQLAVVTKDNEEYSKANEYHQMCVKELEKQLASRTEANECLLADMRNLDKELCACQMQLAAARKSLIWVLKHDVLKPFRAYTDGQETTFHCYGCDAEFVTTRMDIDEDKFPHKENCEYIKAYDECEKGENDNHVG